MSQYFFAVENMNIPFYDFPDEFSGAVPTNIFTHPAEPVPLVVKFTGDDVHQLADIFLVPGLSIKQTLFQQLKLNDIYATNWVQIILFDQGGHLYQMLQVENEIKAIDRQQSEFDFYDEFNGGEFISGMNKLILDQSLLSKIPLQQRLIFRDAGWKDKLFFHKSVVDTIMQSQSKGIDFIPAEGYNEFS
ncbi:hypothetical protein TUM4438_32700 [Shewanella sairae]|uniref:Uncharacterized protein n=1 Tax=Shewanella sairae TaxID=190310 RepID=A0ABQ4PM83_9GAMM|nr:hypothetical protein [Shewanella sairae]MCL1129974.1 hypothetical protein [Shewanella sairae]GIU49332.1 hypothetical protein TUM4438_32700 [Shewanella sairae]